jgi:hypothetical protein
MQGDTRRESNRRFSTEIDGNARPDPWPRQVQTGCEQCRVALCVGRACWLAFHATARS